MTQHSQPPKQEGMALLMVILIIALLSGLIYAGLDNQRFLRSKINNELGLQAAKRYAESALSMSAQLLLQDAQNNRYDHLQENWAQIPVIPLAQGSISVNIQDANRRWNLNHLVKGNGKVNQPFYTLLSSSFAADGFSHSLLDSLIDWLDPEQDISGIHGAEDTYYQTQNKPYRARNGKLLDTEELLLVRGWSPPVLAKITGKITATADKAGLNINTASKNTLHMLRPYLSVGQIEALIQQRNQAPFQSVAALREIDELKTHELPVELLSTASHYFEINIHAELNGVHAKLFVLLKRYNNRLSILDKQWQS